VQAGDAESVRVPLAAKTKTQTIILPRPMGTVVVSLRIGKDPGVGYAMELRKKGMAPLHALTDDAGLARFETLVGRYEVHVSEHHRSVLVSDREELSYPLKLSAKHAPAPERGTLAVQVWEGTEPAWGAFVVVSDPSGAFFDGQPTDELGAAIFDLPPGEVLVEVQEHSRLERVEAARTVRVDVRLDA